MAHSVPVLAIPPECEVPRSMATVITIDSSRDDRLTDFTNLTDVSARRLREPTDGLFIAESNKVITRALDAGYVPRRALMTARWWPDLEPRLSAYDIDVFLGDDQVIREITGYKVHRGALASMQRRPLASVAETVSGARTVAVLEDLVDHTNVGAVFRNAAALGIAAVLVSPECADPLYRRSVRVSMGAVFSVPWTRADPWLQTLAELRAQGFRLVAMSPDPTGVDLPQLAAGNRVAIILGTEGAGLSEAVTTICDERVRIPMAAGVDSLNVAAASAIMFYALANAQE